MSVARNGAAVVKMADGRVLVAGGQTPGAGGIVNTAESLQPCDGLFTATGNMVTARQADGGLLLNDGRS